jgi:hypothetical protein
MWKGIWFSYIRNYFKTCWKDSNRTGKLLLYLPYGTSRVRSDNHYAVKFGMWLWDEFQNDRNWRVCSTVHVQWFMFILDRTVAGSSANWTWCQSPALKMLRCVLRLLLVDADSYPQFSNFPSTWSLYLIKCEGVKGLIYNYLLLRLFWI